MKVLSLFDGMACGMLAMQRADIEVDRYVAYEIDKYAVQTSTHNFPMIEQKGDVFKADFTEYSDFDFLIGGSPCTYWSIAQKNNRETEASGMGWELFSQYVRALHEAKPKFFIYENNKSMSNAIRESITQAFGFEPIMINSALVSAQNRQRLYWVGKRNADGTYSKVDVEQPEDRGILLKDVLDGVAERDKGRAVIGSIGRTTTREYFQKHQGTMAFHPVGLTAGYANGSGEKIGNYASHTLEKGCKSMVSEPVRVGTWPNNAKNQDHDSRQYRIYSTDAKGISLCGNGGGMGAKTGLYAIDVPIYAEPVEWDDAGNPTKAKSFADGNTYIVYKVENGKITIKDKQYQIKLADGFYIIRKLTVRECMRLQTVPEWYEFPVSDSQAYKMLGNGWTVEVIAHLLTHTKAKEKTDED